MTERIADQSQDEDPLPDTLEPSSPDAEEPDAQSPRSLDALLLASALVMAGGIGLFLVSFLVPGESRVFVLFASPLMFFVGVMMFARGARARRTCAKPKHETAPGLLVKPSRQARAGGIALVIVGIAILIVVVLLTVVLYLAASFDESVALSIPLGLLLLLGFSSLLVCLGVAAIGVGRRLWRDRENKGPDNPSPDNSEHPTKY
jgi:hypothetical protein